MKSEFEIEIDEKQMDVEAVSDCGIEMAESLLFSAASIGSPTQRTNQLRVIEVCAMHVLANMAMNRVTLRNAELDKTLSQYQDMIRIKANELIAAERNGETHYVDFNENPEARQ